MPKVGDQIAEQQTVTTSFGTQTKVVSDPVGPGNRKQTADDEYIAGLNAEEVQNVNAITVTIPDTQTPIVIFFGAPSSGKTMALIRMIRWAHSHGLTVTPERVFRPGHDKHYQRMCDNLNSMAYSNVAPSGNDTISFMLVKILDDHGHPLLQILEAPGEHYFKESEPTRDFPTYIQQIVQAPNPKCWVFFCEQDWGGTQEVRTNYAMAIKRMQTNINQLGSRARVVFLFNKADKFAHQYNNSGYPVTETFFNNISNQYPGIFSNYQNTGLMRFIHGPYAFKALCFSVGSFTQVDNKTKTWIMGKDWYCDQLWKAIK